MNKLKLVIFIALCSLLVACNNVVKGGSGKDVAGIPNETAQLKHILGKHSDIRILGRLPLPTDENSVPKLRLNFYNRDKIIFAHQLSDNECTGEYSGMFRYWETASSQNRKYFDSKLPWPDDIEVSLSVNTRLKKRFAHTINVLGEFYAFETDENITHVEIKSRNADFDIEKFYVHYLD